MQNDGHSKRQQQQLSHRTRIDDASSGTERKTEKDIVDLHVPAVSMQVESDMGSIGCGHHHSVRPHSRCMPTCCDNAWSHLAEAELLHGGRCRLVVVDVETGRWDNEATQFIRSWRPARFGGLHQ